MQTLQSLAYSARVLTFTVSHFKAKVFEASNIISPIEGVLISEESEIIEACHVQGVLFLDDVDFKTQWRG